MLNASLDDIIYAAMMGFYAATGLSATPARVTREWAHRDVA